MDSYGEEQRRISSAKAESMKADEECPLTTSRQTEALNTHDAQPTDSPTVQPAKHQARSSTQAAYLTAQNHTFAMTGITPATRQSTSTTITRKILLSWAKWDATSTASQSVGAGFSRQARKIPPTRPASNSTMTLSPNLRLTEWNHSSRSSMTKCPCIWPRIMTAGVRGMLSIAT